MNQRKTHSRFVPYEADYALLGKWRRIGNILLAVVSVLSIVTPLASSSYQGNSLPRSLAEYASYVAILSYYVVDVVAEVFLYPATARMRRIDFIDNSLGAKFLTKATKNYYTNDAIKPGLYKLGVNCFENCYFTYNIAKAMNRSVITKNVLLSLVFLTIAYISCLDKLLGRSATCAKPPHGRNFW